MNQRIVIILSVILILSVVVLAGTISAAPGSPAAQADPTEQQQTINAIVEQRFNQTATAEYMTAPTLTAAFNATVDAVFYQSSTATAQALNVPMLSQYTTEVITLENAGRIQELANFDHSVRDVTHVALAPDGALLVTASLDGTLRLWDVVTGVEIRRFAGHTQLLTDIALSPTGTELASASLDGTLRLWDVATGAQLRTFEGHSAPVQSLAFSPGGVWLAAGDDNQGLVIWNATTGAAIQALHGHTGSITGVAFSPDGTIIASGSTDGSARLWKAATGTPGLVLGDGETPITDVTFSPDGAWLITAHVDAPVQLWNVEEGVLLGDAPGVTGNNFSRIEFSPNGLLLAAASTADDAVTVWDATTGEHLIMLGAPGPALSVAFNAEGTLIASGGDTVRLWGVPAAMADAVTPEPTLPPATETPVPPSATNIPPTATPGIFPTDVLNDVQIAEQVFEQGRMIWIRHNRQIWVLYLDPNTSGGGEWLCYNDTFQEGEPEIDPALVPPENLLQPRRGFGKLWRNYPEIRAALGWALTPEFDLTSRYTYIAGGTVTGEQYIPGPGEHRLTTLHNESFSFFEREVRGDCMGGTWHLTAP